MNKSDVDAKDITCDCVLKPPKIEEYELHKVITNGQVVWTGTLEGEMYLSNICVNCVGGDDETIGVVKFTYHES